MTIGERAATFASRGTGPDNGLPDLIEAALVEELAELADSLDQEADKKRKLYADLSIDGEREARPYEEVARFVRGRIEVNRIQKRRV